MSLRRRLLLGVLAVAAVLVVTNVVLASTFRTYLVNRLDAQLQQSVLRPPGPVDSSSPQAAPGQPPGGGPQDVVSDQYYAAVDPDGTVRRIGTTLRTDLGAPELSAAVLEGHVAQQTRPEPFVVPGASGGGSWRMVAVRTPRGTALVVASSMTDVDATLGRLRRVQIGGTLAVLLALAAVSWWVLRLGVRPLADMAETAGAIADGDLSRRVEHVDPRTEAGRLGGALNGMLTQIEEAFTQRAESEARVRRFAADASHELRTPLTSIRGYADLWRAGGFRGEGELDDAMRRMSEEAARMGVLVDDLLLLARLDQDRPLDLQPVRLDLLARDAVGDARAIEPDRSIGLVAVPTEVTGDEARLRQVVTNLVTNARVHTPPGTPVRVSVTASDGRARLEVADDGPGLDAETATRVFDRFYRADPSRARAQGGSGLGLSIVAAIAEAHGGEAKVCTEPDHGCRFIIDLPLLVTA